MKNLKFLPIIALLLSCGGEEQREIREPVHSSDRIYNEDIVTEHDHTSNEDFFVSHDRYSVPSRQIEYEFFWNGSNYYPIGWSRDGNIAFREFREFDGIGGCLDQIHIQSMVTDKVIKTIDIDEFDPEISEDWDNHCNLDQTWQRERRSILKYLNRYEIQDNSFGFMNKSKQIMSNNRKYTIKLSQDLLETYDGYNYEGQNRTSYKLKVYLDGRSKTISKGIIHAHNIDYLGYYKSPFEERLVIVLQFQDVQGDEYSHNGGIITVGCHLDPKYWR